MAGRFARGVVALLVPLSVWASGARISLRCNLASAGIGAMSEGGVQPQPNGTIRLLDVAVGYSVGRWLGVALGTVFMDAFPFPSSYLLGDMAPFAGAGPSLDGYVYAPPPRPRKHPSVLGYVHVSVKPGSLPRYYKLGLGVSSTYYILNPEIEASWRRVRDVRSQGGPAVLIDQFGVHLRLGLGGWYGIL